MSITIKNEEVRQEALDALSGMNSVVRNDMLVRGEYLTDFVVDDGLAKKGAVCNGHQACAVGSLWLGAGVKLKGSAEYGRYLPGVDSGYTRTKFLSRKPGLKLAYDAMNEACDRYCERNGIDLDGREAPDGEIQVMTPEVGSMERLFEATYVDPAAEDDVPLLDLAELPKIIKSAREAIRRA